MKNDFMRATVLVGGAAVAAFALQGCQTYDPYATNDDRTIFGRGDQAESEVVQTVQSTPVVETTETRQVSSSEVAATQPVQQPDYQGMVVREGAETRNPYEGITRTSKRHVPAPPPVQMPTTTTSSQPVPTADGKYAIYTVKSGDSAGHIANRHGMTRSEFIRVNNISNPNLIKVGQKVKVLAGGKPLAAGPARTSSSSSGAASGNQYTVASGDTLGGIAIKHNVKAADIMAANGISNANMIRVGQKLTIPGAKALASKPAATPAVAPVAVKDPPAPTTEKTGEALVQPIEAPAPDETLDSLIEQTMTGNASLLEVRQKEAAAAVNAAAETTTAAANTAAATTAAAAGSAATAVAAAAEGAKLYTVQEGEDLYSVAGKFQASPMSIRRLNNITGSSIPAGTVIKIPAAGK